MAWRITIFSFQAKHKRPSAQPEAERKNKKLGRPPTRVSMPLLMRLSSSPWSWLAMPDSGDRPRRGCCSPDLVRTLGVVVLLTAFHALIKPDHRDVFPWVDLLAFKATFQSLDGHVVHPPSTPVPADRHASACRLRSPFLTKRINGRL